MWVKNIILFVLRYGISETETTGFSLVIQYQLQWFNDKNK